MYFRKNTIFIHYTTLHSTPKAEFEKITENWIDFALFCEAFIFFIRKKVDKFHSNAKTKEIDIGIEISHLAR